ncbi:MAG: aminopeptidase P family protein [Chlamydiae bacterium]|nr:aminopeptidase P family protein [Chlamydiota bacterium]
MRSCYLLVDRKNTHPGLEQLFKKLKTGSRWCYILVEPNRKPKAFVYKIEEENYLASHELDVESFKTKKDLMGALVHYVANAEVFVDYDIVPFKIVSELEALGVKTQSAESYRQKIFCPDPSMVETHIEANLRLEKIIRRFIDWFGTQKEQSESAIVDWLMQQMEKEGLETVHHPIVAFKENSALPHYCHTGKGAPIDTSGPLLIDLWGRLKTPHAVFADRTFMFMVGREPNREEVDVLQAVLEAQKRAFGAIQKGIEGQDVDRAARAVLIERGYLDHIYHRVGHSIDRSLHGMSMHFDSVEEPDSRAPVPNLVLSLEPAVYLEGKFGVRLESNLVVEESFNPKWTNPRQTDWILLPLA